MGQSRFSLFLGNRKRDNPGKNGTVGKYEFTPNDPFLHLKRAN